MAQASIAQVRRFNRAVTQQVGALEERYLARDRPLGASRVLWEIGDGGAEVRALRARLELDSGYLSRLLRSLEAAGLVEVGPAAYDGRVRAAWLTAAGRRERKVLDRRSDELAAALLEPLAAGQQARLVAAMADVERLLTAATVRIAPRDPAQPDARRCLAAYAEELDGRFEAGFAPGRSLLPDHGVLRPPAGELLVATLRGEPVGCGALKFTAGAPAEIKRMWVAPAVRGLGVGRRLLAALETRVPTPTVRLETNRALPEAIALYRASGYDEVAPFNDEPYAHLWFAKRLRGRPAPRAAAAPPASSGS